MFDNSLVALDTMPKRKNFTANQKAQIVLEISREDKTIAQIASENGIHQGLLGFACFRKSKFIPSGPLSRTHVKIIKCQE